MKDFFFYTEVILNVTFFLQFLFYSGSKSYEERGSEKLGFKSRLGGRGTKGCFHLSHGQLTTATTKNYLTYSLIHFEGPPPLSTKKGYFASFLPFP